MRFDINGVFQANQFQQGEGGDYLINQVAAGLNDAIAGIKDLLDGVELIPSRYGGDEFVVFISGYILPDQVIQITNKIKESIKDKKAYFGENGEERNISIKKDEIEIIDPSQIADETKKQLFYLFLNRGIILSLNELNAEYERIKGREGSIEKYLQEENAQKQIYPPGVETLEQKIEYFINLHPELKVPFYLARFIDRKYGDLSRQENLLFFIENNLFDPLLNRITMNRQDLPEHFKEKQFKLIWSFEIKLKEINEHKSLGYVYADEVIEKAWVKIRKLLQDKFSDDWEKYITVGRFGGLIFIGLKNYFNDLADDDLKKIQNELKQIQLEHYGITHDIGFAQIIPEEISGTDDQVATNLKIEKTINTVFSDPDIDWYMKRASFLKNLPTNEINIFIDKLIRGELEIDESEIEDINTRVNLELLLSYFLNEKRGTIRRGNFVNVIADELKSDLSWLIEIFQKIENEKQNQSGYL